MKWQKLAIVLLILAALFWNSWILGWLNHGSAGYLRMSISELNVINQPHYFFFTLTEYISGIFLILAVPFLILSSPKKVLLALMAMVILSLGLLTLYDAANPLDCDQYHNPVCLIRDETNTVSIADKHHNEESRITAYMTVILSLLVIVWLYYIKSDKYLLLSTVLLFIVIAGTLETLNYGNDIFTSSILERVWNAAISIDFVIIGFTAIPEKTNKQRII